MKSILLVNPLYELEIRWIANEQQMGVRADYFPLGLATVAALTPDDYHVEIWDELVRGPVEEAQLGRDYDLVGVTSHRANFRRTFEIARYFRERGSLTAVGGPGVSGTPDRARGKFDVMFIGECELIWPEFLQDWEAGRFKEEYRQIEKPDLTVSPPPRWDSIEGDIPYYAMGTVQTTRGCPFDCEFCDVIYLNGRAQRRKTNAQILQEVAMLQRLGVESVSFNDDNFTAAHKWAKDVLRDLIELNNSFPEPLRFSTQLSVDVAQDDELLELLADANFYQFLVGIESPNKESLRETHKVQNLRGDLVEQVHKILSYGTVVRGGLIVGFDHDDQTIFDEQYDFIQECRFPSISLHMLNAPMGTRLWRRLQGEKRVINAFGISDGSTQRLFNNIIPKRMTRVELMEGFHDLYLRVFSWGSFVERMIGFVDLATRPPRVRQRVDRLEDLLHLGESLNLDAEACDAMETIFRHTMQKPFLIPRVKELVIQFLRYRASAHEFMPALRRQIEMEASGRLKIELDQRPLTIPDGFAEEYRRKYFHEVHDHVYRNLDDKDRLCEAIVDVFVDFLTRSERFEGWEGHHPSLLREIADRTCAIFNGVPPERFVAVRDDAVPIPSSARKRLFEDVLNTIEQQLLKLANVGAEGLPILAEACPG